MLRPLIIAAATLTALPLAAQDAEQGSVGPQDTRDSTYLQSVDDTKVVTADGEEIGEISEILVDADGKPAGFLVEMGGFLDLGDTDVAIPLGALEWSSNHYVSKMAPEQLENLKPWDE